MWKIRNKIAYLVIASMLALPIAMHSSPADAKVRVCVQKGPIKICTK